MIGKSNSLPLRSIECAWLAECSGDCYVDVLPNGRARLTDLTFATETDKRECLMRLNNAFVEELCVCFACNTFLPFLREHCDEFHCRLSVLSTHCSSGDCPGPARPDLADFVAQKFAPSTFAPTADVQIRQGYIKLLEREALRNTVEHLNLKLENGGVPHYVVPELFNVNMLKTCNIECTNDPAKWIDEFFRTFEQAGKDIIAVDSVTILHKKGVLGEWEPKEPSRLVHPAQTGLSPPRSAFLDRILEGNFSNLQKTNTVSASSLYVFENPLATKQLHVFTFEITEVPRSRWAHHRSFFTYYHDITHFTFAVI